MSAESSTPLTDAAIQSDCVGDYVHVDFAQGLEREITELKSEISAIYSTSASEALEESVATATNLIVQLEEMTQKRDKLRADRLALLEGLKGVLEWEPRQKDEPEREAYVAAHAAIEAATSALTAT